MRTHSLGMITLLAALSFGCGDEDKAGSTDNKATASTKTAEEQDIGEVLATVNGLDIGSKEFQQAAGRKQPADGNALSLEEKQEVLDGLVDEKLLYQAALTQGLDRDPKVQKVMVNTLLRQEVYSSVRNSDFTDEELQAYYEEHKDEFIVPEKVQIKRILIKSGKERSDEEALAKANEVQGQLKADPSKFKELASKNSEDPYRRRGGDVGFVARTGKPGLDPEVVDKAFELNVETVSDVFKTSEGFNIILVANKRERVERSFQQMKGSVLRKVKNQKLKTLYEDYVAALRKDASIKVDQDKLSVLEVKSGGRAAGPGFALDPNMPDGEEGEEGDLDMGDDLGDDPGEDAGAAEAPRGLKAPKGTKADAVGKAAKAKAAKAKAGAEKEGN